MLLAMPIVALLVTLATAVATPLDESPAWSAALRLLDDFAYEEALHTLAPLADDEARAADERAIVLVRMAMIEADLRREPQARERLRQALRLDREVRLPDSASPRMRELLDEVHAELPPPAPSSSGESSGAQPGAHGPSTVVDTGGGGSVAGAPNDDEGMPVLAPALLISGGLVAVGGLAAWGTGLALYGVAEDAHYQSEAVALGDGGAAAQIAGQVMVALGVVVLASGTAMVLFEP